jgi:8-oxo-dGTP diphosphatase
MPNAFESGAQKAIPAVLVYAFVGERVLLIHRGGKPGDYHEGKWNGLGGKLEAGESPLQAARRELAEESGLELPEGRFRSLGALTFPDFKAHKHEDWIVFVFRVDVTANEAASVHEKVEEGSLHWIAPDKIPELPFWAGDRHFLPFVLSGRPFVGTIWYEGQEARRHWIQPLTT